MSTSTERVLDRQGTPFGELVETHVSWVFLGRDEVVKRKKPVRFPFLDFSTSDLRRAACEAEVALNRRLAPDVYLGVVPLTRAGEGILRVGGDGEVVDHAVSMRRLDDAERADVLLAAGRLHAEDLERVAEVLVRFHAQAPDDRAADSPGSQVTIERHVRENLAALAGFGSERLGARRFDALAAGHVAALERLGPTLARRGAGGRVRDGHGDLRLEHVYLGADGTLRILDCVEFDRAFRVADVAADVAFLAMDLHVHGRSDLAERFVARYVRDAADHELYRVVDFFVAYFALVRAKVSIARAAQAEPVEAEACRTHASAFLELAERLSAAPQRVRALLVFAGPIGSGKSTLAQRIGRRFGAPVIESDRLRKQLQGVAPEARLEALPAYGPAATERVYEELRERARAVLASGRSVILDATYRARAHRDAAAALADEVGVPYRFVSCTAPRDVLAERLRTRASSVSVSDARVELLDDFLAHFEPLAGPELDRTLVVDTCADPATLEGALAETLCEVLGVAPDAERRPE